MKNIHILLFSAAVLLAACNKPQPQPQVQPEGQPQASAQVNAKKDVASDIPKKKTLNNKDFFRALVYDSAPRIQEYLQAGANINAKNENGQTPLQIALMYNKDPRVSDLLIHQGADTTSKDAEGANILIAVAGRVDSSLKVRALLDTGIDPNEKDINGRTALISAAPSNRDVSVILELIAAGADVNAKNSDGWTPLDYAVRFNKNPDIIRALLKYGARPQTKAEAKELAALVKTNPFLVNKGFEQEILKSI